MAKLETKDGAIVDIVIFGVVSEESDERWRIINGSSIDIVSNYGKVAKSIGVFEFELRVLYVCKTYKGHYYNALIKFGKRTRTVEVHRLVCEAFNGKSPDGRFDVNHKDANKINNYYKNLEWMTRSDNVLHAYTEGLCKVGIRVEAKNIRTTETKQFNTLSEAARFFGIPRHEFKRRIAYSVNEPYLGEWVFKLDYESDRLVIRKHIRQTKVMCFDYATKTITITETMQEMASRTGVSFATIFYAVKNEEADKLTRGYVFRQQHVTRPWPVYSDEAISRSLVMRGVDKGKKWINVIARNYSTGEIKESRSLLSMVELLIGKKTRSEVARYRAHWIHKKAVWVLDWLILGKDSFKAWPEIKQEEIGLRKLDSFDPRSIAIEVTDLSENTTKVYPSVTDFAKTINVKHKAAIHAVNEDKILCGRYRIKAI